MQNSSQAEQVRARNVHRTVRRDKHRLVTTNPATIAETSQKTSDKEGTCPLPASAPQKTCRVHENIKHRSSMRMCARHLSCRVKFGHSKGSAAAKLKDAMPKRFGPWATSAFACEHIRFQLRAPTRNFKFPSQTVAPSHYGHYRRMDHTP